MEEFKYNYAHGLKFIKVHELIYPGMGEKAIKIIIHIKVDQIAAVVRKSDGKTEITLAGGARSFLVEETADEVFEAMQGVYS